MQQRFRKAIRFYPRGFLVAFLGTIAFASLPIKSASASIIYSGVVDTSVVVSSAGGITSVGLNFDGLTPVTLTNANDGGGTTGSWLGNFTSGFEFEAPTTTSQVVSLLKPGGVVSSAKAFSVSTAVVNGNVGYLYAPPIGQFAAPSDSYFGFEFQPAGSPMLYGWGQLTFSADALTVTLVDLAYDDGGSPIIIGQTTPVPEPASVALGLLGVSTLSLRRCRRIGSL